MDGISFSGLSSGIDTRALVDQLMQIERRPITSLQSRQSTITSQQSAWESFTTALSGLQSQTSTLSTLTGFQAYQASMTANDIVGVSLGNNASPGNYEVEVLDLAESGQAMSVAQSSSTTALSLSGEALINGEQISIDVTDDLLDIQDKINDANAGVSAWVMDVSDTEKRLMISSQAAGDDSLDLKSAGTTDIWEQLGFVTTASNIKNAISGGADSDTFSSKTTAVGTLLDLDSAATGTVTIGDQTVSINLATDSLEDIKSAIDTAAPTGVTTSIVSATVDGQTTQTLRIDGTTTFVDNNNVLRTLGVLEGRSASESTAEVHLASAQNTTASGALTASDRWVDMQNASVTAGDTITISGKNHNGQTVSATHTINNTTDTVQDFLTAVETAFGNVTASFNNSGQLVVTDDVAGESELSITLAENNEGGGTLNFGSVSVDTNGNTSMRYNTGQDARMRLNGIQVTRGSNTVDDLVTGVTFSLLEAEPGTTIDVQVERSISGVRSTIQGFVDSYNEVMTFINDQFSFDPETLEGGVLLGDSTLSSVQTQLRGMLSNEVSGLTGDYDAFVSVGIESDAKGLLSIDAATLDEALSNNFNDVVSLFIGQGTTTDTDIEYISHTNDTSAGTYNVNITQAAEQPLLNASTAINMGGITQDENLTLTDLLTNEAAIIALQSGDTLSTIVDKINTALAQEIQEVHTSDTANTTDGSIPVTAISTFGDVFGAGVLAGDTIAIAGTDRNGGSVSSTFTINTTSDTLQSFLSAVENAFDGDVNASLDSSGKLVVTDDTAGSSNLGITITANNEGGGSLNFGSLTASTEGRGRIYVTASDNGGVLQLTHDDYGSHSGFSIVSDVADLADGNSTGLGTTSQEDYGLDVEGTINGEWTTGTGQLLQGNESNENTAGLQLQISLTTAELASQGSSQGTVTLTRGVTDQMNVFLDDALDTYEGLVTDHADLFQNTYDDLQDQIDQIEDRLVLVEERLTQQFVQLERALSEIQAQGDFLTSQLAGLS